MVEFSQILNNVISLFLENTTTTLIIFFLGFLIDHIIMSFIQASKGMSDQKFMIFLKTFFFMPPR